MISALAALERLVEGNRRFASNTGGLNMPSSQVRPEQLADGQEPFAVVLGCSDSRVPAEIIFDLGLGDLFVIRVAGNIVAPSLVGSVEFAVEQFRTRLVVVLGHTRCGAIAATLDYLERPAQQQSPNLLSIVDRILPAVEPLIEASAGAAPRDLAGLAGRANIRASANHLRHGSVIIERQAHSGGLLVVGAEYAVETGRVEFFDGAPA